MTVQCMDVSWLIPLSLGRSLRRSENLRLGDSKDWYLGVGSPVWGGLLSVRFWVGFTKKETC